MSGWRGFTRARRGAHRRQVAAGSAALAVVLVSAVPAVPMVQTVPASTAASVSSGPWTLSTTDPSTNYAPTFIGNG